MPGHLRRNLLIALALLIAPAAVGILRWLLPGSELKDAAGIVQAVITAAAIIGGGIIAAYKLQLFRDFAPHLTITHEVSHRPVGDSYVHIAVKATLHNSSRVVVKLRDGRFRLWQITPPITAENVLYQHWPMLEEGFFALSDQVLSIEPGQTVQEVLQFIVPSGVAAVLIHYFFQDSRFPDDPLRGWGINDVYDIIDEPNQ